MISRSRKLESGDISNGHVRLLIGDLAFRHGLESSRYSSDFLERY
jgi:hypothetical protein